MSRGLAWGSGLLAAMVLVLLWWEVWSDSYVSPAQMGRTLALAALAALAGGLAWMTRV